MQSESQETLEKSDQKKVDLVLKKSMLEADMTEEEINVVKKTIVGIKQVGQQE